MSFPKNTHPHVGWLDDHPDSPGVKKIQHDLLLHQESIIKTTPNTSTTFTASSPKATDDPDIVQKPVCSSKFVDNITMEYMMNRQHYKKYLAKTDKNKYEETKKRIQNVQLYQSDIMNMVNVLIQDYISCGSFSKYNSEINHTFESFMNSTLRHLEENPPNVSEDDDDTLFNIGIGTYV